MNELQGTTAFVFILGGEVYLSLQTGRRGLQRRTR